MNGTTVENPKFLLKEEKKLQRAQKKLSRMKKGSNNWKKQLQKSAAAAHKNCEPAP
ncbi:transposase [Lentibacillus sp. CBA3610]|uniref:transposase n=1 Tax=Lentibacillus sp. CBA3610 TaxID=2518176 RepID=UPI0020D228A3|nr:transposase [Lentibacillus sp. CBA3610]